MPYRAPKNDTIFLKSHVLKCNNCGLLQIDKKFTAEAIEDYYKHTYDREDIYHVDLNNFPLDNKWSVSRGRALATLVNTLKVSKKPCPTIMDLGCGYGHLLYGFNHYFDHSCVVIGVDYDEKTQQVFDKYNWTFRLGGLDNVYQQYTRKIDILITSHVFEHVIAPHDFLNKCSHMLADDGILLWEMPNLNEFNLECEPRHSPHICLWDIHSLREILIRNNFEVIFLKTAGKKYTWFDKKKPLNILANKFFKKIIKNDFSNFDINEKSSIGFQLDIYGDNRRNLRLIAQKKNNQIVK